MTQERDVSGCDLQMRGGTPADMGALERLYAAAFPSEDLLPLVRSLLAERAGVLSLVASSGGEVAGHLLFTRCSVPGCRHAMALLGPLAVAPGRQRQGIGAGLVRDGLRRLRGDGVVWVLVLGNPAYYGRFGFAIERDVVPPYALPPEWRPAWQSVCLAGSPDACQCQGQLELPRPWLQPSLWAP